MLGRLWVVHGCTVGLGKFASPAGAAAAFGCRFIHSLNTTTVGVGWLELARYLGGWRQSLEDYAMAADGRVITPWKTVLCLPIATCGDVR